MPIEPRQPGSEYRELRNQLDILKLCAQRKHIPIDDYVREQQVVNEIIKAMVEQTERMRRLVEGVKNPLG